MPSEGKARKKRKKSLYETPFIVRVFEKHIKDWKQGGGLVYATPKRSVYTYLMFQKKSIAFFETKWYITALYEVVNRDNMNEALEALYRKLKGMECSLESKGLIRKDIYFKENEFLSELRLYLPDITISNDIAKALNEDEEVMDLLQTVKPDDLTISLHSIPSEYQPFIGSKEAVVHGMIEFYTKPLYISWVITLGKMLGQSPGVEKKGDNIIKLLEEIADILKWKMDALKPRQGVSSQEGSSTSQNVS